MHYCLLILALLLQGCDNKPPSNLPLKISPLVKIKAPIKADVQHKDGHGHATFEHHSAHTHGLVNIQIIAEGSDISVDMSLPSADAVGFEHAPTSDTEKAQLTAALNALQAPDSLFTLNASAGCTLKHGTVETALQDVQPAQHPTAHGSSQTGPEHADIDVFYAWHCANPRELKAIGVNLFSHFKSLATITADIIINGKQSRINLTPKAEQQIPFN